MNDRASLLLDARGMRKAKVAKDDGDLLEGENCRLVRLEALQRPNAACMTPYSCAFTSTLRLQPCSSVVLFVPRCKHYQPESPSATCALLSWTINDKLTVSTTQANKRSWSNRPTRTPPFQKAKTSARMGCYEGKGSVEPFITVRS